MTMRAAKLLEDAFELHMRIASQPNNIALQSPSWGPPRTPYDYGALLVKSLIPYAYNLQTGTGVVPATRRKHQECAEWIYDQMIYCGQVIDIKHVNEWWNENGEAV